MLDKPMQLFFVILIHRADLRNMRRRYTLGGFFTEGKCEFSVFYLAFAYGRLEVSTIPKIVTSKMAKNSYA